MDKAQATAVADAMLQRNRASQSSTVNRDSARSWSRKEWLVAVLLALQVVVAGAGVAVACRVPIGGIIFIAELCGLFGFMVACLVIACHRVLRRS